MDFAEIFSKIGLDWRMLLANAINFLIFLFILNKFIVSKIATAIKTRNERIESSLNNAKQLEDEINSSKNKAEEIISEANIKANELVTQSKAYAEEIAHNTKIRAQNDAEFILENAKKEVESEKEKMLTEVREKTADLAILATEKIIKEKVSKEDDKKIILDFLNKVNV